MYYIDASLGKPLKYYTHSFNSSLAHASTEWPPTPGLIPNYVLKIHTSNICETYSQDFERFLLCLLQ
jgi:hypothetical protein